MSQSKPVRALAVTANLQEWQLDTIVEKAPAKSGILSTLAGRPDLTPAQASTIWRKGSVQARGLALRKTDDAALLAEAYTKSGYRRHVCRNPRTSEELLTRALEEYRRAVTAGRLDAGTDSPQKAAALAAACNPSTPLAIRKEHLKEVRYVQDLVSVATPIGAGVVRAGELYANNLWMSERTWKGAPGIERAMVGHPAATLDLLDGIAKERPHLKGTWKALRDHPLRQGMQLADMTMDELLAARTVSADIEALSRPEFEIEHAARIICRDTGHSATHMSQSELPDPEPHVIAAIIRRYMASPWQLLEAAPIWAGTRLLSTAWLEPLIEDIQSLMPQELSEIAAAVELLNDSGAMENFMALAPDWSASMQSLAEASNLL